MAPLRITASVLAGLGVIALITSVRGGVVHEQAVVGAAFVVGLALLFVEFGTNRRVSH